MHWRWVCRPQVVSSGPRLVERWRQRTALTLLAACLAAPLPGVAEEPTAAAPEGTATIGVIPGARIVESIDQTRTRLRDLQAMAAPDAKESAIGAQLPATLQDVEELDAESRHALTEDAGVALLSDLDNRFRAAMDRMQGWQRTLADRVAALESALDEVRQLRERWEDTRESASKNQLPTELVERVTSTLSAIRDVQRQLTERRGELLAMQAKIAEQQTRVDARLDAIAMRQADQRRRILALDSQPLWRTLRQAPVESMRIQIDATWARSRNTVRSWIGPNAPDVWGHVVLFVVILAVILAVRVRTASADDSALTESVEILSRPVSAAALLTLVIFGWFHPRAPLAVVRLVAILMIAPLLRLLLGGMPLRLRRILIVVAGLSLVEAVTSLAVEFTLLQRLLLLVTGIVSAAAFGPAALTGRGAVSGRELPHVMVVGARVAVVLLAVALLANVVGNVSLAAMLTHATLVSGYLGVVLLAAARIVDGVVVACLRLPQVRSLRVARQHADWLNQRAVWWTHVALALVWITITLRVFGIDGVIFQGVQAILGASASVGSIVLSVGGVLSFAVTLWITVLLSRAVTFLLEEEILPRLPLAPGVPAAVATGARYIVLIGGFLAALGAAGLNVGSLTLLAGALSIGIGFGLQNVVNNFVSGLILLFERPLRLGDTVEIGALLGTVRRIGFRSSTIRTPDGADVIVPNGTLISERVVNWTLSDRLRRIELSVGVAYGTDPQRVIDILKRVAAAHPRTLGSPPPAAVFVGFGDSSLNFTVRFWTAHFDDWGEIRSEVAIAVNRELQDAGIEIPFPQRELRLRPPESGNAAAADGDGDGTAQTAEEHPSAATTPRARPG